MCRLSEKRTNENGKSAVNVGGLYEKAIENAYGGI